MAKNKKRESYLEKEKSVKSVKKDDKKSTLKNKFQVLDSDSEEEQEEVEEEEVEEEVEIISEYKITYASVCAAVNKVSVVPSPLVPSPLVKACSTSSGIKPMLVNGQRAWADYSSDEDEDEE